MKNKTKPKTWQQRITDIFYDDYVWSDGKRMLHTWVELVVIVLIGAAAMAVFVGILSLIPFPEPHKIYEREYAACMAQDTLTHEVCHDIALEAID